MKKASISHAWRALRHRNFRLFFVGQGISVIGSWMTKLATQWLVYQMTHSALLLGVVTFAGQILTFLLGPFAGVWVERLNRRKLLITTQVAAAVQALTLAILTLGHWINLWEIICLTTFQGIITAFDNPTRQSFLIQMVNDRNDLVNAIAINSSLVNGARLIGPALAGMVISTLGEGWCFLIDGMSYFAVIVSLNRMQIHPIQIPIQNRSLLEQMSEGWEYVRNFRPIRSILLLFSLASLVGYPYFVLLPVFTTQVFHSGPDTLGWLTGASGTGGLISALSLTLRKSFHGLPHMIAFASFLLGLALILFGLSKALWASLLLMSFAGFGLMQLTSASNTIIQSLVTEDKRARVMSYYTMAFFGASTLGSLLSGLLADQIGGAKTIILMGIFCILGSIWFFQEIPKIKTKIN